MEAWVTWLTTGTVDGKAQGAVAVHVHTPSHDHSALLLRPQRQPPDNASPDYMDQPPKAAGSEGMWVITHAQHVQWPFYGTVSFRDQNSIQLPTFGPFVQGRGDIVTVQTSEKDGGVLNNKRAFVTR
jgi:hypothetical protein